MESTDRTGLRPPPRRTCVGCKETDSRSALLRVVVGPVEEDGRDAVETLVPDPRHRLPGRGAWLHPTGECLDLAVRRRAFGRALRASRPVDPSAVADWVAAYDTGKPSTKGTESGFDADEHPMSTQR